MENQEHQDFDADAAFDEAAQSLERSGELTANNVPSDAPSTTQDTPDQREEGPLARLKLMSQASLTCLNS